MHVNPHAERIPVAGSYWTYPIRILHECATVEVITWVKTHRWYSLENGQQHYADATGAAVIISPGKDGELVFTRKPRGDSFLVSTNFNVADPAHSYSYPCWRYEKAQKLLGDLVKQGGELTVRDAAGVLDAVHVEGRGGWTLESMVADLASGSVYLYYFRQFDRPVVLNVREEIANRRAGGPFSELFPEDVQQEAARRYQSIQREGKRWETFGKAWLTLVAAALLALLIGSRRRRRTLIFWLPVVAVLGPFGLLIWFVAGHKTHTPALSVLVEATGDVAPTVVAFVAAAVGVAALPGAQASQGLQLMLFFGLPVLLGLVAFQASLLVFATGHDHLRQGHLRTVVHRLPHSWVAANLGMAAVFALATPLANKIVQLPLSPWIVAAWWAFAVVSALVAMLLLIVYEGWCVRRGYRAWTIMAWGEGEVAPAPWRKLWWWIPLSYGVLIAGLAGYMLFQQVLQT